jgi:hypothetical protein
VTTCPNIHAYISTDAPDHLRWLAFYQGGKKLLPMYFTGSTRDIAVNAANAWWERQQGKAARAKELADERAERMRKPRAVAPVAVEA